MPPAPVFNVSNGGFDPSALRARQSEFGRRIHSAIGRIGDAAVIRCVGPVLEEGDALAIFGLLTDPDARIRTAAHECVMLRYAYLVAIVAQALGLDEFARDDLVQRTFVDLPRAVARTNQNGRPINDAEGWLRRRAYLIARQMYREEYGTVRNAASGSPPATWHGAVVRTRGSRISIDAVSGRDEQSLVAATVPDETGRGEALLGAIRILALEQPLWAEIIRLHYFENFRLDEIARRIGRSHGTVRNEVGKARIRLAAIVRERFRDLAPMDDRERDR